MGPLALADQLGLDTVLDFANYLFHSFRDPKYRPCLYWREWLMRDICGESRDTVFHLLMRELMLFHHEKPDVAYSLPIEKTRLKPQPALLRRFYGFPGRS